MTVLRANFGSLLEPGLAEVFFHEFDTWDPEYPKIHHVKNSEKRDEDHRAIIGLGLMGTKAEGVGVTYEDIEEGYGKSYTHETFGRGIRITQEMYEDDLYGVMRDLTTSLSRSAIQRMEVNGAAVLNNAFTAGASAGPDGVALISAAHVMASGGANQSNALAAAADLDAASLQEAIQVLEDTQNEKGLELALRAKTLVCTTANQWAGAELLHSTYKPGTADNEINALQGKGLEMTVNHYLTDADSWFLLAENHKINWYWRKALDFFKGNDFDTQDCKFIARMRFSNGFSDFRGVTGSQGA